MCAETGKDTEPEKKHSQKHNERNIKRKKNKRDVH